MLLAGEESIRLLIKEPSQQLIDFIQAHSEDEDKILSGIPRFEIPKSDFEGQVLREMRAVMRENAPKIAEHTSEELMTWTVFLELYQSLDNFEYPHKDKLLEFIKYFFLDHLLSKDQVMINFLAFKEHLLR